jgi:hypothetical protein
MNKISAASSSSPNHHPTTTTTTTITTTITIAALRSYALLLIRFPLQSRRDSIRSSTRLSGQATNITTTHRPHLQNNHSPRDDLFSRWEKANNVGLGQRPCRLRMCSDCGAQPTLKQGAGEAPPCVALAHAVYLAYRPTKQTSTAGSGYQSTQCDFPGFGYHIIVAMSHPLSIGYPYA